MPNTQYFTYDDIIAKVDYEAGYAQKNIMALNLPLLGYNI